MLRLKRLKVHKFRHVVPGTELTFDDEWNVVLGKNAAGKTTLLSLIAAVAGAGFTPFIKEAFRLEFELQLTQGNLTCVVTNAFPATDRIGEAGDPAASLIAKSVSVDEPLELTAECTLKVDGKTYVLESGRAGTKISDGKMSWKSELGVVPRMTVAFAIIALVVTVDRPNKKAKRKLPPGVLSSMEDLLGLIAVVGRFDESLGSYQRIVGKDGPGLRIAVRSDGTRNAYGAFGSREFVALAVASFNPESSDGTLVLPAAKLQFLRTATRLFGFVDASISLAFRSKKTAEAETTWSYGPATFHFVRSNGDIVTHRRLSYGQKRMLAFLYYAEANVSVIIADELVNGLHHDWIETSIDAMRGRQKFLTSQNPLLLDHLAFKSSHEAKARFVRCSLADEGLRWENLSEEQADRFFRGYEAGIQFVGELLRQEGLW